MDDEEEYLYGDTDCPENILSAGEVPTAGKTPQQK